MRVNEFIFRTCNYTTITLQLFKMINLTKKITLTYFSRICSRVSQDLFYRTPFFIFVVNNLCTVFSRQFRIMSTIRSIIKSFQFPNHVFLQTMVSQFHVKAKKTANFFPRTNEHYISFGRSFHKFNFIYIILFIIFRFDNPN